MTTPSPFSEGLGDAVRPGRVLFVATIAVLALGWVASRVEWEGFRDALDGFRVQNLLGVAAVYIAVFVMRCRRAQLLVPEGPSLRQFFPVVGVGFLAAVVVPLRLGILVRPWLLERYVGVPFGVGAAGAVAERMLDVVFLLLLILGVAVWAPPDGAWALFGSAQGVLAILAVGGLGGMVMLTWLGPEALRHHLRPLADLGGPLPGLVDMVASFSKGMRSMGKTPRRTAWAVVWSWWMWSIGMVAAWIVMAGFPAMTPTLGLVSGFWASVISAAAAVPTPASVGPFEAAGLASLTAYGVPPDLAGAVTVVMHLSMFTMNASIGFFFLALGFGGTPAKGDGGVTLPDA